MGQATAAIGDWPVAAWVVLLGAAVFLGKYALLRWQWFAHQAAARQSELRLTMAAAALRAYADGHLQRLPDRLDEVGIDPDEPIAYRSVPRLTTDERLILIHDAAPVRKVLEFPSLRDGRGVLLCSGRLLVVTEAAFEKLLAADDALRARLGLATILNREAKLPADGSSSGRTP